MKKRTLAAVGLACALALSACNNDNSSGGDGATVATVDGQNISESEFVELLKDRYGEPTLQEMISLRLIEKAKEKVEVTDEEIDEELTNFRANFGTDDDQELLASLKEQFNIEIDSIDQLIDEYIIPPLIVQKIAIADVDVTDEEIKAYFEENKDQFPKQVEASHILVEDEETANEILEKINAGDDFAELAKEYSIDGSAATGGELGYFHKEKMVEPFSEKAFSMNIGDVSEPVKSEFGYHIIKVSGQKEAFEDYMEEIEAILTTQQAKTSDEVMEELMKEYKVEIKDAKFSDILK